MPPSIPSIEPDSFAAGETTQWQRTFADYPATDGWTVMYYFAGADAFQVAGVASGSGFLFTLGAIATATKQAGTYQYRAYAEKGAVATQDLERHLLRSGTITLLPDITAAAPGDFVTHEERTYAILCAALEGRLTADIEDYQIGGKSVRKIPIEQLRKLKVEYAWAVYRQRHRGKIGVPVAAEFYPPDGIVGAPEPVSLPPWLISARYGG